MTRRVLLGHANSFHDPAICIATDDVLFAEGVERHMQCKRAFEATRLWYSREAVLAAMRRMGLLPLQQADVTCLSTWNIDGLPGWALTNREASYFTRLQGEPARNEDVFWGQFRALLEGYPPLAPPPPAKPGLSYRARALDHHLTHAANAVYTSPFSECVVMVIDGYGERNSIDFYHFHDDSFRRLGGDDLLTPSGVDIRQSFGSLYTHVTFLCGFRPHDGEEWKVMGLAGYGRPRREVYDFFRERLVIRDLRVDVEIPPGDWPILEAMVGGFRPEGDPDIERSADLAHNFQWVFEDVVLELVRRVHALGLSKNLAFAGGCALNSSLNGKLVPASGFRTLHVPMAPADDGNALGAVLHERHSVLKRPRALAALSPYLGSEIDPETVSKVVGHSGLQVERIADASTLCDHIAGLLADGRIIGWMQGRAEFGPRALGNRSILADPRPPDMKDRINARVKFREEYRPFAPSILHEFGDEYFENFQESPYMERTLRFRESARAAVPAVVHVDGTGRLQTVRRETNPKFHALIEAFRRRTGIPLLLNTSFNVMGKPIVHSVEDALTVLFTTGLDHAVIGDTIFSK
jgi:carbamoyltransferase